MGWVVGISWAILSLGGMITNLIAIHKIVKEYKEFLKSKYNNRREGMDGLCSETIFLIFLF